MDALIELLPLLFVGAYYLLASRRRAQQRKQAARSEAPQQELVQERSESTPFESFLANLEASLAEAGGVAPEERVEPVEPMPAPDHEPVVPLAPTVERPVPSLGSEFSAAIGSFDAPHPVDHDAHGFGAENPYSEESFERAPAFREPARTTVEYDPHGLRDRTRPRLPAVSWNRRLQDPATARDAFVLQTIFGRHGGRRGDRR